MYVGELGPGLPRIDRHQKSIRDGVGEFHVLVVSRNWLCTRDWERLGAWSALGSRLVPPGVVDRPFLSPPL